MGFSEPNRAKALKDLYKMMFSDRNRRNKKSWLNTVIGEKKIKTTFYVYSQTKLFDKQVTHGIMEKIELIGPQTLSILHVLETVSE